METPNSPVSAPPVLFGAFDRHNFGDLLFPHLMTALLPGQSFEFAGLVERDLQAFGGHRVSALAARQDPRPAHLIHVGGELLTCSAWQAAVMLLEPAAAATAVARYDDDPAAAADWAARQLGTARSLPYVAGRDERQAELAAVVDALMQDPDRAAPLEAAVIAPLEAAQQAGQAARAARAEATRVQFFAMQTMRT